MRKKLKNISLLLLASFIISAGWNWSHTARQPHWKFLVIANLYWLGIFLFFILVMLIYKKLTAKKHEYWTGFFFNKIPELFFILSLGAITFFCSSEILNLVLAGIYGILFFWRLNSFFKLHPTEKSWQNINKNIFIFAFFFFIIFSAIQYFAHSYYILEDKQGIHLIVLLRSLVVSLFWLTGLVWAQLTFYKHSGLKRWTILSFWLVAFVVCLILWIANIGILSSSGLYLSPIAVKHASGAGKVIWNQLTFILIAAGLTFLIFLVYLLIKNHQYNRDTKIKPWYYFAYSLSFFSILSIAIIIPAKKTPEVTVLKDFYNYYFQKEENIILSPIILEKLKNQFGLEYHPEEFYPNRKEKIFQIQKKFLPEKFYQQHPNILIIFVESLSANLTNVYENLKEPGVTPNLVAFAKEKDSTVIKNYFNASTPTVTGILSQLCSFLPTTGHEEINGNGHWTKFYLRCLPNILQEESDYKDSVYVTAVEKNYANKSTIYESIGVKKTYGTEELYKFIPGEPLGWGWTDHQMFPALVPIMNEMREPFLFMFSTVDTHAPYTMPKDMLTYGNGKSVVLNSYYTTDNAFGKFWNEFKSTKYYPNTITIVVADHAMFPGSYGDIPGYKKVPKYTEMSFYDENAFILHIPDNILPKEINTISSGLDFAPTLLHMLNVNVSTTFEGYSIFEDRAKYPNVLGMHEIGLYINQETKKGRQISYDIPSNLNSSCEDSTASTSTSELTLCEFEQFYKWKRQMMEQGRLWFK